MSDSLFFDRLDNIDEQSILAREKTEINVHQESAHFIKEEEEDEEEEEKRGRGGATVHEVSFDFKRSHEVFVKTE